MLEGNVMIWFQDPHWHEEAVGRNVPEGVLLPGGHDLQWPESAKRSCQKTTNSVSKAEGNLIFKKTILQLKLLNIITVLKSIKFCA